MSSKRTARSGQPFAHMEHRYIIWAAILVLFSPVFVRAQLNETAKLTASDGAAGDFFGEEVSLSGDTAIVGTTQDDDLGDRSGSAYVFVRNTAAVNCPETGTPDPWCQQAKLLASDGAAGDFFGDSVSLSGDTAVVGAASDDDLGDSSGSAYVFVRDGDGNWSQQAKLRASDGAAFDDFGSAVSLSGDMAVVGAFGDDDLGDTSGSAYVFVLDFSTSEALTQELISDVLGLNIQGGISNSLDAKLEAAVQALDDVNQNNDAAAINSLQAFINYVEAQRGAQISAEDADTLIAAAEQIIALLGG